MSQSCEQIKFDFLPKKEKKFEIKFRKNLVF